MDRDQQTSAATTAPAAGDIVGDFTPPPTSDPVGGSLRAHLTRGVIGTFAIKAAAVGLGYALTVLLTRMLGPAGYGTYAYAFVWVGVLALPATAGLEKLLTRKVAKSRAREDWPALCGIIRWMNRTIGLLSLALGAAAAVVAWLIAGRIDSPALITFWIALLMLPLMALSLHRQAVMRGLHNAVADQTPEILLKPAVLTAAVVTTYFLVDGRITPPAAMGLHVIAAACSLLVGSRMLARRTPSEAATAVPSDAARTWMRSAMPMLALGGMQMLNIRAGAILLGVMKDFPTAGVYIAAGQGAVFVAFAIMSANMVLAPIIADLHARRQMARLQRIVTFSTRAVLLASAVIAAGLVLWRGPFMEVFGEGFSAGSTALAILVVGQFVNAAIGSVGVLLMMTGHECEAAWAMALGAAVNILLCVALIGHWSATGAAITTAASLAVMNIIMVWRVRRRLGLDSTVLGIPPATGAQHA